MIKKTLMVLFFLFAISHAATPTWQGVAGMAIMVSLILLGVTFMIGYGFSIKELVILSKEEAYQVLVLAVLIAVLSGTDSIFNTISQTEELSGTEATMQDAAITSIGNSLQNLTSALNNIAAIDNDVAKEASETIQCSLIGIGYSVSGCGGFAMLASPFSLVGSILGLAGGSLFGALRLIELSTAYSFTLLLPLGIILRTFRFTRGAGGLLMAVAISTYLLLPLGILFVDKFGDAFTDSVSKLGSGNPDRAYIEKPADVDPDCNPGKTMGGVLGTALSFNADPTSTESNEDAAIATYNALRRNIRNYLYLVLVKGTLGPAVALLMMVGGIRVLTKVAGAEIDVSALARLV